MKIALIALDVNPPCVGGVVNSVLSLARAFRRMSVKVHVLTNRSPTPRVLGDSFKDVKFHDVGWFLNARSPQGSISFCLDLVRKVRSLAEDGVRVFNSHSGYPQLALATGVISTLVNVEAIHTVYSPTSTTFYFKLNDKLLATSKNIYIKLSTNYPNRVYYVGNGVDTDRFIINRHLHKNNEKIIFIVGVGRNRGLDSLIRALPIVKRKIDVKLLVALSGGRRSDYEAQLAKSLGVEECIEWLDAVEHIEDYYAVADVFVLPLRSTYGVADVPNSVLEAYACGVPVVATEVGGIPEAVDKKFLVPMNDHLALAKKILEVLDHSWDPMKFRRIAEQHSWKKVAERYLEVLV